MLPVPGQWIAGIGLTICVLSLCAGIKSLALLAAAKKTEKRKQSCSK